MNRLIENKLRKLIQKEIKSVLKEDDNPGKARKPDRSMMKPAGFERPKWKGPKLSPIELFTQKVITSKDFKKDDVRYYRNQLADQLMSKLKLDNTQPITFKDIIIHPKFEELDDRYISIIRSMAGMGIKSPNKEFLKLFAKASIKFPDIENTSYREFDDLLGEIIYLQKSIEDDRYPNSYFGFTYSDKKELTKMMNGFDIRKKLTSDELAWIRKVIKPKYDKLINEYLSDSMLAKYMKDSIKYYHKDYSDEHTFAKGNIPKDFPDFFQYVKSEIISGTVKWNTLKVKAKMVDSKHSDVVSSSFSTYYYYDVDVSFMGKEFEYKNIRLGSSYYSGGWN